jgi:negative regulator of sigma E activity
VSSDVDILRRSMAAEPADWLDHLVTERVVAQVQREGAPQQTPAVAHPLRTRRPRRPLMGSLRAWLSKLVPPGVQLLRWHKR